MHVIAIRSPKKQGKKGQIDLDVVKRECGGRILITRNHKDFVDLAPIYDFGIISLSGLFLDKDETTKNETARLISKTITDHSLWSKNKAFLVTFDSKTQKPTIEDLE